MLGEVEVERRAGGMQQQMPAHADFCQHTSLHLHLHHAARGRQGFSGTKTRKCDIGLGAKPSKIQGRDRPPTGVLPSPFPHAIIFRVVYYY
jgi:hypothetical protein